MMRVGDLIGDEQDALALAVGTVVINAGSAEGKAGELLMLHRPAGLPVTQTSWNASGEQLFKALRKLDVGPRTDELHVLADRLEQVTERRNDVVHGEWAPGPDGKTLITFRRQKPKVAPEGGYAGRVWTLAELHKLAKEYLAIERGLDTLISDGMKL